MNGFRAYTFLPFFRILGLFNRFELWFVHFLEIIPEHVMLLCLNNPTYYRSKYVFLPVQIGLVVNYFDNLDWIRMNSHALLELYGFECHFAPIKRDTD